MFPVVLAAVAIPSAIGFAYPAVRRRLPQSVADVRGIALQTVIIMVVLLAIAGGVAAALLQRGGEAITEIERQKITREPSEFKGKALCDAAGHTWTAAGTGTGGTCS